MLATSAIAIGTLALITSSVMGVNHTVQVGVGGAKTFTPNEVTAAAGDIVLFQFVGGNHTTTQSTFASPCAHSGFDSGFMPNTAASTTNPPTYAIMINDTTPVWVYCRQTGHCASGMVMAINADDTSTKSFSAFQAAAMSSGSNSTTGGTSSTASASGSASSDSKSGGASSTKAGTASGTTTGTAAASTTSGSGASKLAVGASGIMSILAVGLSFVL